MSQNVYPAITAYQDGEANKVQAAVLNKPINQLRQRTDFLYDKLQILSDSGMLESVRLKDIAIDQGPAKPELYDSVYLDPVSLTFKKAMAAAEILPDDPYAVIATVAYSFGVLVELSGDQTTGTVAMYGKTAIGDVDAMMAPDTSFTPGPFFLSPSVAGKLTRTPADLVVYMGFMVRSNPTDSNDRSGYMVVAPQYRDMWEAHVHKRLMLTSQPLGKVETSDDPVLIDSTQIVRGLLPTGDGITPPTATPPLLMHVLGEYDGTDPAQFVITLNGATTIGAATVTWTNDDGDASPAPIKVGYLERPIYIGRGLSVVFERNAAYSSYGSASFDPDTSATILADRKWTLEIPDRVKGWRSHWTRQTMIETDAGAKGYRIVIFGRYVNAGNVLAETFRVVGNGGNFATGGGSLVLTDSLGHSAIINSIGYASAKQIVISAVWTGLWLMVSKYAEDGTAAAAGTVTAANQWTTSFTDEAPGAKFEYSMDTDKTINTYYPCVPETELMLEMNGVMLDQRDMFVTGAGAFRSGKKTVYWYNDTYGYTPYPSSWIETLPHYDDYLARNCLVYFNLHRVPPHGMVRSLTPGTPAAGSVNPIRFTDCNGNPAKTGDMQAWVDLNLASRFEDSTDLPPDGNVVIKGAGNQLVRGPAVRSVVPGPGILVDSLGGGSFKITSDNRDVSGEFDNTLYNAKQEILPNATFSYIRLLPYVTGGSNIPNSFAMQMRVPYSLGDGTYRLCFYLTMFGTSTVASTAKTAGLKLTYNMLQDYNIPGDAPPEAVVKSLNLVSDIIVGTATKDLILPVGYEAYDAMVIHNDPAYPAGLPPGGADIPGQFVNVCAAMPFSPIMLAAGNLFSLKIERTSKTAGDEYLGASLGFIAFKWVLKAVSV